MGQVFGLSVANNTMFRGGGAGSNNSSGLYTVQLDSTATTVLRQVGFRCAK